MYFLVSVYHNSTTVYLTRSECEGFKNCCISNAVGLTIIRCGMAVKRMGTLGLLGRYALTEDGDRDTD